MKIKKIPSIIRMLSSTRFIPRRAQTHFVINSTKGKKFEVVYDIGAGVAPHKKFVNAEKYFIIDTENRSKTENVIIGDANKELDIASDSADLIILTEVIEHLYNPQIAIKEAYRILRKGGMLILTCPMTWMLHEEPHDYYRFTKYGLKHLMKNAGYSDFTIKPSSSYFVTIIQLIISSWRGKKLLKPLVIALNLIMYVSLKRPIKHALTIDNFVLAVK